MSADAIGRGRWTKSARHSTPIDGEVDLGNDQGQPGRSGQIPDGEVRAEEFYLVALGASAGGLEPLEEFFDHVPPESGLAYVVIQHLSPKFKSLMPELLARHTGIEIKPVEQGMTVERDTIYLIPPSKEMVVKNGQFHLSEQDRDKLSLPIDVFFRSAATEYGQRAVGLVLSGTGSDGSHGIAELHEAGALTIAQDPVSAKFDGMPKSAIATGLIDWVLPIAEIPDAIVRFVANPVGERALQLDRATEAGEGIDGILELLRRRHGVDFASYKVPTVLRRIERRLVIVREPSVEAYRKRLADDAVELRALYEDLLIGVTRFFRDEEGFALLGENLAGLMGEIAEGETLRIWVAGCASGEEAYSVAMLAAEAAEAAGGRRDFKMFATDINARTVDVASTGCYPEAVVQHIPTELRDKYLRPSGGEYEVIPELRQRIVFARHDLLRDAPFTRIDLVTCRNLLIYLDLLAQKRVLTLFQFALRKAGILFLGPSEALGELESEFATVDRRWRVYRKRRDRRLPIDPSPTLGLAEQLHARSRDRRSGPSEAELVYAQALDQVIGAGILVSEHGELVHTFGEASRYLRAPSGRTSLHVGDLLVERLRTPAITAMERALRGEVSPSFRSVSLEDGPDPERVTIEASMIAGPDISSHVFLTIHPEQSPLALSGDDGPVEAASDERYRLLDQELRITRENLQATIEELETSNEELQATNEEMVSSNEELQSTNEELHSVNEELYTVNAEYQQKINELLELTEDMDNLLASSQVGTIFLDRDLNIRKFTPAVSKQFSLTPGDVGRPIAHFTSQFRDADNRDLVVGAQRVLDTGDVIAGEVQSVDGGWYLRRLLPFRNSRDEVDGVIVTMVNVDESKLVDELRDTKMALETILEATMAGYWDWFIQDDYEYLSPTFKAMFGYEDHELPNRPDSWQRIIHPDDLPGVLECYELHVSSRGKVPFDNEVRYFHKDGSIVWVYCRGKVIDWDGEGRPVRMVGCHVDITPLKRAEALRDRETVTVGESDR